MKPIGLRNLYAPLVTLTGMAMLALRPWVDGQLDRQVDGRVDGGVDGRVDGTVDGGVDSVIVRAGLATVTAVALGLVGVVAWANAQVFAERVSILEEAVAEGRDEVVLPPYPHPRWVHGPDDDRMGYHYYLDERYDIVLRFAEPGP